MSTAAARRGLVVALSTLWALASLGLVLAGGARWWRLVAPESSPMTWLQSVVLVLAATFALMLALVAAVRTDRARTWTHVLLAAGFAGLALDERFALHERLRDRVLAPRDVGPGILPWVAPGDVVLLVVAAAGLVLLRWVLRALSHDAGARRALWAGVALSVVAVAADSVDPARWGVAGERLEQTLEEVLELAAGLSLLAAVALPVVTLLVAASAPAQDRDERDAVPTALGRQGRAV